MPELPRPSVVLISGIPGAGKTTVSRLVAEQIPYSALVDGDTVHDFVYNGRAYLATRKEVLSPSEPLNGPQDEVAKQLALHDRNVVSLAENLAAAGFIVIIDDVFVVRWRLDRLLTDLRTRPVFMVTLDPAKDIAEARDVARHGKTVFPTWAHLYEQVHAEIGGVGCWIDSSSQTPAETAAELLSRVWTEGLIA
jgi:predicted kinase